MPIYDAVFAVCDTPGCESFALVAKKTLPSGEECLVHKTEDWDIGIPLGSHVFCPLHKDARRSAADKEQGK